MACIENEGKCFTFLWKLENISYCLQQKGQRIESPAFVVDALDETKWKLMLFPKGERDGNYIGYFLHRDADSKGADKVTIKYELAFIAKDKSILKSWKSLNSALGKGEGFGIWRFEKREDVFVSRRLEFLPQDTLMLRCRIWKCVGELTEDILCTAHTRIGVQRKSFLWNVKNFSTLELEKIYTYHLKSLTNYSPLMSLDLSLSIGLRSGEIIRFALSLQDPTIKFSTLQLSLIDASGNKVQCNEDEFRFDNPAQCEQFNFAFTKKKLLALKSMYLPNDVLSLHWEFAFSKGIVLEETEEVHYVSSSFGKGNADVQNVNNEKNANLKLLCDKKFLCDVELKTSTSVYPAHKIILSASSSVFCAMFSSDMKEKNSYSLTIEDLSDDAVSGMLQYIYTERVEDLSWEKASHLYVASDKYDIPSLKNMCSSYLKYNLSPSSACEVLLLSDFHADDDLKAAVQDYILIHIKDVVKSDEWKIMMETNTRLAAETVCLQYK